MSTPLLLGFLAGLISTSSFVPQVFRTYRTRQTRDLSLNFILLLLVGFTLWLFYGASEDLFPIIFWNSINLTFTVLLLAAKLLFKETQR